MVGGRRLCWQLLLLPEWNRTKEGGGMELGSGPLMECTLQPLQHCSDQRNLLLERCSTNVKGRHGIEAAFKVTLLCLSFFYHFSTRCFMIVAVDLVAVTVHSLLTCFSSWSSLSQRRGTRDLISAFDALLQLLSGFSILICQTKPPQIGLMEETCFVGEQVEKINRKFRKGKQ